MNIKKTNVKSLTIIGAVLLLSISCNKKNETPSPAPVDPPPAVVCFNTNNNGTYTAGVGAVQVGSVVTSFTNGVISISRTSCQEVNLSLTSSAGNKTELVKNVTLNSSSEYEGSISTGSITMSFGSHLHANAPGSFTFTGHK